MPATVGIIYPPPEVRSIVDKTATFVARNGPEFEEKIRANEISNPKFNFLSSNDPYHAYYQHKIKELREGKTAAPSAAPVKPVAVTEAKETTTGASNLMQNLNISSRTLDTQTKLKEQMIILKDPPSELEFILEAPSITPLDVDTIKLTAQFVARNGKPFLAQLMNKEQRNPMFDFLKPQHSHFQYFNKLVEQYTKILMPPKDLLDRMRQELNNPFSVMKSVQYRVEWERADQREKAKEHEIAEKERIAYAQIDWHDFVVVETVDFQPHEMGNFPPPTTPADVGARVIALERLEASGVAPTSANLEELSSHMYVEKILADESRVVELAPAVDDDRRAKGVVDLPLPPNPENVIIRKDYDPKNKNPQTGPAKSTTGEQYYKSPITGELIPASKMAEHMRISMLNPDWMKQKEKERKEREENEEVIASGFNIEANLKRMAEYRSDMFGTGSEETVIGHKKNTGMDIEDSDSRDDSIWAEATKREEPVKYGSSVAGKTSSSATIVVPPVPASMIPKIASTAMTPQMGIPPGGMIQQPPAPSRSLMLTPSSLPPPPSAAPMPVSALPQLPGELAASYPGDEPFAKRQKTEEQLIPEAEFLTMYPSPVTFGVQVPHVSDKPEWSLNGQFITLTLPLTETVATIKNKLAEILTMPIAKQKLQLETMFIKDTNTLAFYNITPESVVHLQLKERGGRKK